MKKEWFATWFDSPYYHVLYKTRDDREAHATLDNMLRALSLPPGASILDLACGKGRHSRYLADLGFEVTGIDISQSSITHARQFEREGLAFYQHDMRRLFRTEYFDAVVNFFTSFGYFEKESDNLLALRNVWKALQPGGLFLLDYFNSDWVRQNLVPADSKTMDAITFRMTRHLENGHVVKTIDFDADTQHYAFEERVRLFSLADFQGLFAAAGFQIIQTYGDYNLGQYEAIGSKRLIIIAKKVAAT